MIIESPVVPLKDEYLSLEERIAKAELEVAEAKRRLRELREEEN
jgi:hypothetical protein